MKLNVSVSSMGRRTGMLLGLLLGVAAAHAASPVTPVFLNDGNSSVSVDINSSMGMYGWSVDGVNQLSQQWFWYRVGNAVAAAPINSISAASPIATGNTLTTSYNNNQLGVQIQYVLTGGTPGSGTSDMLESITLFNHTASALTLSFFQYSDFDLQGAGLNDSVSILSNGSGYYQANESTPTPASGISETVTLPYADRAEASLNGQLLTELNNNVGYNLNDVTTSGPGDASWGFQWNFTIAAGSSVDVIKDKHLDIVPIPEPATLALLALGLGGLMLRRRGRA